MPVIGKRGESVEIGDGMAVFFAACKSLTSFWSRVICRLPRYQEGNTASKPNADPQAKNTNKWTTNGADHSKPLPKNFSVVGPVLDKANPSITKNMMILKTHEINVIEHPQTKNVSKKKAEGFYRPTTLDCIL